MNLKKSLGKNIKKYRKNLNLTQEKLAEIIGIDPKNVSKIENGNNYPSSETISAIAKALNINLYELFIFDNNIPYEDMKNEIIKSLENKHNILCLYKTLKNI